MCIAFIREIFDSSDPPENIGASHVISIVECHRFYLRNSGSDGATGKLVSTDSIALLGAIANFGVYGYICDSTSASKFRIV